MDRQAAAALSAGCGIGAAGAAQWLHFIDADAKEGHPPSGGIPLWLTRTVRILFAAPKKSSC